MDAPGPTPRQLAKHLQRLREAAGLSVIQFAERAEISVERVVMLESGAVDPDMHELAKYARGLGMTMSVVFRLWERALN
ncbi:MAG TPA: helix-turn-helix transcriptional regulator [Enhygromyxa sp.]|nr:helix-turn-helix transcriptional regulator [Enhygromyxa sp.]